jgi:hypothetical protein
MPIREVRQSGETKNPRRRRKKRKKTRGRRGADHLKQALDAMDLGVKLGANVNCAKLGAKVSATSPSTATWIPTLAPIVLASRFVSLEPIATAPN